MALGGFGDPQRSPGIRLTVECIHGSDSDQPGE
jgi:hypothetical protein